MAKSLAFSAWLDPGDAAGLASLRAHAGLLSRLYPLWYTCGPLGKSVRRPELPGHRQAVLDAAKGHGLQVWPCLFLAYGGAQGTRFESGAPDEAFTSALLDRLREDQAQGLCFDSGLLPATAKEAGTLVSWAGALGKALHGQGLKLGWVARVREGEAAAAFGDLDLAGLAGSCDRLQVLGFRSGAASTAAPGPLAPAPWCGAVLGSAAARFAPEKMEWTLPGPGLEWRAGGRPTAFAYAHWEALMREHPPEHRDPSSREIFLRRPGLEAWTNDSISLSAKLWEIRGRGVSEAALWNLGSEDPRLWALLETLPGTF